MKRIRNKGTMVMAAALLLIMGGCVWTNDPGSDDSDGYCYTCDAPPPIEVWDQCGAGSNTLIVGSPCGCGQCCGLDDLDYSVDTVWLDSWDSNIVDMRLHYTLTNWGGDVAPVNVWLCDYLGCVDVISIDLYPYEVYEDYPYNLVLDSLLDEYFDCLWTWGDSCVLDYDVEVDLEEQCSCSTVTLDYSYQGLFVY
ncbi:MAG TPA: hypothetical protein VM658_13220 [bacterium]|nr:hypothetical protein [bacterium]